MPLPIRFRPPAPMSDEELFLFSSRNEVVWIEREANGDIHIKPISATLVSMVSSDVACQLAEWAEREERGKLLAGAGFFLADGSMLGPHIALVSPKKWATIAHRERDGFASFAPDFVVEFNGPWDEPGEMHAKMQQWIANGVEVAWLIDPIDRPSPSTAPAPSPSTTPTPPPSRAPAPSLASSSSWPVSGAKPMAKSWSDWQPFPDPRSHGMLIAPFGPGCYEVRRREIDELVCFGMGGHVAFRMTSLLPQPLGRGTRNNAAKRYYIAQHLPTIEYRTVCCSTRQEALELERSLKANRARYKFPT